jgi:hypothetical protein
MVVAAWVSGIAAIGAAATLLVGTVAARSYRTRPWLVVLFMINAGDNDVSRETLRGVQPVDVWLLALAAAVYMGFWPGPGTHQVMWMSLAIAQPLLGIPLLMSTHLFGRSGLMGGALVLSILMLGGGTWSATGWLGLLASLPLLVGDFGTSGRASRALAVLVAVGYGALMAWFAALSMILLS